MPYSTNAIYADTNDVSIHLFVCMVVISQLLGISMLVLVGLWLGKYLGGFAWDGSGKEFNVHPLCMVVGMVFLYGEAILSYRVFRNTAKMTVKLLHAGLLTLSLALITLGLVAVFQNHNQHNIGNLYSLHSWCGLTTVVLFGLQLICGFGCFLFPYASQRLRSFYFPLHRYFGTAILFLGGLTCVTGINEKLIFKLSGSYQNRPAVAVLGNLCGIVIVLFIFTTIFIVQREDWRREPNISVDDNEHIYQTI